MIPFRLTRPSRTQLLPVPGIFQPALPVGLFLLIVANLFGCSGGSSSAGNFSGKPLASTCGPTNIIGSTPTNKNLASGRAGHTATLLSNGTVLVIGGSGSTGGPTSAELYDPATRQWVATGSLNAGRVSHTATLLPNGTVLVVGGSGDGGGSTSAELYDPTTGGWTLTTGNLNVARAGHTATLLPNGTVLVAGGYGSTGAPTSAEIITPSNGIQTTLTWDSVSDPSVTGYKLYYGTASRTYQQVIDVGLSTTYAFSNLNSGTTYYFSITAYSFAGEGCPSSEVSKAIP